MCITIHQNSYSVNSSLHFPGGLGLAGTRNVSVPDFIGAKNDEGGGDNWELTKCAQLHLKRHHQQTNTQFFYRPECLPVAQPTVSK